MARPLGTTTAAAGDSTRNRGALLVAAVSGILSAVLIFAYLSSQGGESSGTPTAVDGTSETVVTVTQDVRVGDKITKEMLQTKVIPKDLLVVGRISNIDDIDGKVATAPILAGEQVAASKVTTYEGQNSLAYKVPDGMRALGLEVPNEAWIVGGLPQPGDRVDILGITTLSKTDPLTGQEKPDVLTGIIAQDVEILAMSQTLVKKVPNTDAKKNPDGSAAPDQVIAETSKDGKPLDAPATYEKSISVTLALPPDLAAKVALMDALKDDIGQYRLLPRQKGDAKPIDGRVTWSFDDIFNTTKK